MFGAHSLYHFWQQGAGLLHDCGHNQYFNGIMIIIIPLGGIGSRFKENNYKQPKALIKIFGKPILFWLLDSLQINNNTIIYIPYNIEYVKYRLEDLLKKNY